MVCDAIRGNGCAQELKPNWKYCPRCGSLTARLTIERVQTLSVVPGQPGVRQIPIAHYGGRGVPTDASLRENDGHFEIERFESVVAHDTALTLKIGAIEAGVQAKCVVRIKVSDEERDVAHLWEPSVVRTVDVEVKARAAQTAQLLAVPATAILHPSLKERPVRILNLGGMPLHIDRVRATEGFDLKGSQLGDFVLMPGAESAFSVLLGKDAPPEGKVDFIGPDGTTLASLKILRLPSPPPAVKPRFIVGIDFGTSNTSVVVRDTEDLASDTMVETVQFLGKEERFPTVIYCRSESPRDWFYGADAKLEYDRTPNQGEIVWELKTLLRTDEEPCPGIALKETLLKWYFRELLDGLILPYIAKASGGIRSRVQFVFSLPVLDRGSQHQLQASRTRAAWEAAGFPRHGAIQEEMEPVCAALYLLNEQRSGSLDVDLDDGDRILVFDSGGGTTDIALGTVRLRQGKLSLEDPQEVGSHHTASGETRQFGGTTVTHDLGTLVMDPSDPYRYKLLLSEFNERVGRGSDDLGQTQESNVAFDVIDEDDRKIVQPEPTEVPAPRHPPRWYRRFAFIYDRVENAKRELTAATDPKASHLWYELTDQATGNVETFFATKPLLDGAIDHRMKPVLESMLGQLREGAEGRPERPRFVFAVGGNCCVPRITDHHLAGKFDKDQLIDLPPAERFRAVPAGTVYAVEPEVRTLPYSIEIVYQDKTTAATFGAGSRRAVMAWADSVRLSEDDKYRLTIRARLRVQPEPSSEAEQEEPIAELVFHTRSKQPHVKLSAWVERLGDRDTLIVAADGEEALKYDF